MTAIDLSSPWRCRALPPAASSILNVAPALGSSAQHRSAKAKSSGRKPGSRKRQDRLNTRVKFGSALSL